LSERFVADEMNGDIARWLRILGYDCEYLLGEKDLDEKILEIAERDDRTVLTADKGLIYKCIKRDIKAILTRGERREEKIGYLRNRLGLDLSLKRPPRCSICNALLKRVGREEVEGKAPAGITDRYRNFWICPPCGKAYWEGSHWKSILRILGKVEAEPSK
jgi:uncharacterized protein with PIN domain